MERLSVAFKAALHRLLQLNINRASRWACDVSRDQGVADPQELLVRDRRANTHLLACAVKALLGRSFDWPRRGLNGVAQQVAPKGFERFVLELEHHSPTPGVAGK